MTALREPPPAAAVAEEAGLGEALLGEALPAAAAVAARAVRVGRAGVRVRMPVLGSVEHGTRAAALRGCPCLRCEQERARLTAGGLTAPAPELPADRPPTPQPRQSRVSPPAAGGGSAGRAGIRRDLRAEVDPAAVERAAAGGGDHRQLTVAERAEVVRLLHRSGHNDQAIARRTGITARNVLRIRQRLGLPAVLTAADAGSVHDRSSGPQDGPPGPAPAAAADRPAGGAGRWRAEAVCLQVDPELFFRGSSVAAKAVCERCPVTAECLEWAIEHDQRFGVWGGMSAGQRTRLRRERRVHARGGSGGAR